MTASTEVADALAGLLRHDVAEWHRHGLEPVKERTVRTVLRGRLGEVAVHVKVFRADTLSDRARDAARGPRGAREAGNLLRARALGLPAVEPLAFGLATDAGTERSFVVTRTVEAAREFSFALPAEVQARVGRLLRRVHDSGVIADDLHPGNLLVDAAGEPWLVDLTSFRHGGEPGAEARAAGLALFCQTLDGGPLSPAARTLTAAYREGGDGAERLVDRRFDELCARQTRRWRAAALPKFGRRSERSCRHTESGPKRRGQPQWFWHLDPARPEPAAVALRDAARSLAEAPPTPHKSGRRGAVWLTDALVMKQREQSLARRLWRASYWLLFAGVPAPRPVALRLFRRVGLVLVERIANVSLADELARGELDAPTALAGDLGRSVGRLHACGLRNRDLKLDNLVRVPGTHTVVMVDLDGVRRKAPTDTRGRGRDLGRLLAAFRAAGSPGGDGAVGAFLRGYLRSHRELLMPVSLRRVVRRAEQRAREWAKAHS